MTAGQKNHWAAAMATLNTRSWEEVLEPHERLGGPTPYGSSFWGDFKACPYYFDWTHNKGWRPVEYSDALEIGGLVHEAIARYYQTAVIAMEEGRDVVDQDCVDAAYNILDRAETVVPVTAAAARRLVRARLALYGPGKPGDDRLDTYGVEVYLGIEEPFPLTTRLDRWCWSEQLGGAVLHELKTAKERSGRLLSSYRMDHQFLIQQYLWKRVMGRRFKLKGYVVDLVTKTQDPDVLTISVPIDDRLLKDFEKEMQWTVMQWRQCQALGTWPRNRGYRCRFCPLFEHCASAGKSTVGWRKGKRT